jgi:hypothetical protein
LSADGSQLDASLGPAGSVSELRPQVIATMQPVTSIAKNMPATAV